MRQRKKAKYGLTLFELVISLTIISVFAATMMIFINRTAIIGKEKALQVELKSLRMSLVLYNAIKGKYPENLKELFNTKFNKPTGSDEALFGEKFLSVIGKNEKGYPIDPFGNRFNYDSRNGVVGSSTKGYENW